MAPGKREQASADGEPRRPLHFPIIPPLPCSSSYDKENQRQRESSHRSDDATKRTGLSSTNKPSIPNPPSNSITLTPQSRNIFSRQPLSENRITFGKIDSISGASPQLLPVRYSHGNKRRVLRYGETLDSLFCLTTSTTPDHRRLCEDIIDGPLADDAASWRVVLEVASVQVTAEQSSERGADLIRLHRRATSRFASYTGTETNHNEDDILALWLSYARAQASYGSTKDARSTYKHIQNQRLGLAKASFYIDLASFERKHDIVRALHVLRSGIEQKAEPLYLLTDALKEMASEQSQIGNGSVAEDFDARNDANRIHIEQTHFRSRVPPLATPSTLTHSKKRKPELETSPKRMRKNDGTGEITNSSESTRPHQREGAADATGPDATGRCGESKLRNDVEEVKQSFIVYGKTKNEPLSNEVSATFATMGFIQTETRAESNIDTPASLQNFKSVQKKSSLQTKTRISRVGLSGKAQRVNPDETVKNGSGDDSTMDGVTQNETQEGLPSTKDLTDPFDVTRSKPLPKISQMDLSYMLNWDPFTHRGATPKDTGNDNPPTKPGARGGTINKNRIPPMAKIDESIAGDTSGSASAATALSTLTSTIHSNEAKSIKENESHLSDRHCHSNGRGRRPVSGRNEFSVPLGVDPDVSPQTAALVAKCNVDFLPLVCEDNIVRVNNIPYAKLGVIGKGGSCKVYRALSKDCSILAIKKVKLGGMDQKAINGYANEIALLKRLRGNPAIIQMYDSEVDLSRKAIFVAMELGEVDLNQVIQQQTLRCSNKQSNDSRSKLDMNFIRLTWQQMLKAVHSIHEERIIHGDLKPANFLFVRGALKLIDFGIAKAIQSDDTTNIYRDSQIGTLNYMSPEAILDTGSGKDGARLKIGRASDIWSLGCILYQMVYGKTPFAELQMIQKLQAIVNPNHKIRFPGDVEDEGAIDAMQLCLQRNSEERPPIVGESGLLNEHFFLHSGRRPLHALWEWKSPKGPMS